MLAMPGLIELLLILLATGAFAFFIVALVAAVYFAARAGARRAGKNKEDAE